MCDKCGKKNCASDQALAFTAETLVLEVSNAVAEIERDLQNGVLTVDTLEEYLEKTSKKGAKWLFVKKILHDMKELVPIIKLLQMINPEEDILERLRKNHRENVVSVNNEMLN